MKEGDKGFTITFDDSYENEDGETEDGDSGFIDEDGVSMLPDEDEVEDGMTAVDKAVDFLLDDPGEDGIHYSDSDTHLRGWWTKPVYERDYQTGLRTDRSYHPYGFTVDELSEIRLRVAGSR